MCLLMTPPTQKSQRGVPWREPWLFWLPRFWLSFWSQPGYCFAAAAAKSLQLCPTLYDPIDGSPPASSVPGILQSRILEWVAISFSNACMHAKSLQSCPTLCDPMDSSLPGSSVHRTLQARIPEWVAISFSQVLLSPLLMIFLPFSVPALALSSRLPVPGLQWCCLGSPSPSSDGVSGEEEFLLAGLGPPVLDATGRGEGSGGFLRILFWELDSAVSWGWDRLLLPWI